MLDQGATRGWSIRVGVSSLITILWALFGAPTSLSSEKPGAEEILSGLIAQRTAELAIKPKTAITSPDLALEAATAIKNGDYAKGGRMAEDVRAQSHLENWRFYPFNEFIGSIVRGDDPVLLEHLNRWIEREPESSMAYLFRSMYYQEAGWVARGSDLARMVPARSIARFREDIRLSRTDVQKSISLNPKNPSSYYELLRVAVSEGDSPDGERIFLFGIRAFPNYYPLYQTRLRSLRPKWGGSIDSMYAFVERYADVAPKNSPLKLLYLELYADVLDDVALQCKSQSGYVRELCVDALFWLHSRHGLEDHMAEALNLYKVSDPVQFSTAVWPLLETISCNPCIGSPAIGGRVLQQAASVTGSDNRIMDEPTHNSYVLDDVTARVWAQMDNSANAEKKFREALRDVERTPFPDEAEKAAAMATILDHMAAFADDTRQYVDIIVYHDAANSVGGINHTAIPWRKCYAYYHLKYFAAAVKECTALIETNGNYPQTHYWRAKAYEGLRQWDASIADFTPVADSADNWFRVGAALDMSYEFGQKGDYAGQLASMNRYPYLFDPALQPPHDLAVAFNNRCFAYMKLGQLKQALDDCTMSLKYDRIPDAYQKQQQLLKMLATKT
jgi:tetratricopeptide (TPR) repeat protein